MGGVERYGNGSAGTGGICGVEGENQKADFEGMGCRRRHIWLKMEEGMGVEEGVELILDVVGPKYVSDNVSGALGARARLRQAMVGRWRCRLAELPSRDVVGWRRLREMSSGGGFIERCRRAEASSGGGIVRRFHRAEVSYGIVVGWRWRREREMGEGTGDSGGYRAPKKLRFAGNGGILSR